MSAGSGLSEESAVETHFEFTGADDHCVTIYDDDAHRPGCLYSDDSAILDGKAGERLLERLLEGAFRSW
jgi:hypothetical protein